MRLDFNKISVHDTPKRSPGFLLWRISTSWRSSIEAVLKKLGLTHPQFVVLATVGWMTRHGRFATQINVGTLAGLDPNTTSQIIKGLEKKKYVKRAQASDGRAKNVALTEQGSRILQKALPAVEKADGAFFETLTKKEMSAFIALFQKLMPKEEEA
jgi:DNA-binding MarR family transcriptional regulator